MAEPRGRVTILADVGVRYIMCRYLQKRLGLHIVTEYPKSGGTWFAQLLAASLGLSFPRNEFPRLRASVMHGHYLPIGALGRSFCVLRDGRDVMVSYYYHSVVGNELSSADAVSRCRQRAGIRDYEDIESNLPAFMRYVHERDSKSLSPLKFTWGEFVEACMRPDQQATVVRYEDLLREPVYTVKRALHRQLDLDIDSNMVETAVAQYAFKTQTNRDNGESASGRFLRKGTAGEWRERYSPEARQTFAYYYGEALVRSGYEADNRWVEGS